MYKLLFYFQFVLIILLTNCGDNGSNPSNNNIIECVTIGSQIWMKKNLDVDHYRNGDSIPQVTDSIEWANLTTGAWCYYNNDPANGAIYGKLYNWYAVNDPRGLAPTGWHVPSDSEWTIMENYLISNGYNFDGTLTENKIGKALATASGWYGSSKIGAVGNTDYPSKRNASGFSALPSGYHVDGSGNFYGIDYIGNWWTSTEKNATEASYRYLDYNYADVYRGNYDKDDGFSVRCVMNGDPIISSITPSTASIGDTLTISGSNFGNTQESSKVTFNNINAVKYISWSDTQIKVEIPTGTTTCKVSVTVYGKKSNEVILKISTVNSETVTIGTQVWKTKNLDVDHYQNGDSIPQVTNPTAWANLTTGAWCYYNNNPANGEIYGKLYNWYAINDPRGLAPQGWHVPTDEEWAVLSIYLGGTSVAGGKLKEAGTVHWNSPNTGATNESGFTALPGGWRHSSDGVVESLWNYGGWWTTTEVNSTTAGSRSLGSSSAEILIGFGNNKGDGFSVRCVKD